MNIQIAPPVGFSKIGARSNNEDSIYPLENDATEKTKLFVVCDGMGGHNNGEIASRLTSKGFAEYLSKNPQINEPKYSYEIYAAWDEALKNVESEFDEYVKQYPDSIGMGTTLCFCHFHSLGVTLGHIGDSRIYQIRGNNIIFKSEDHSMVNELLKSNQITEEEAANHSQKNVITRAVQGGKSPSKIEYDICTDIQVGDFFFMCTDGVLEQINDRILESILSQDGYSIRQCIDSIVDKCENVTKDNFSGYLIQIRNVEGESNLNNDYLDTNENIQTIHEIESYKARSLEESELKIKNQNLPNTPDLQKKYFSRSKDILVGIAYGFGTLLLALLGWIVYSSLMKPKEETPVIRKEIKIDKSKIVQQKEKTPIKVNDHTKPEKHLKTKPALQKSSINERESENQGIKSNIEEHTSTQNRSATGVASDVLENLNKKKQTLKEETKKPKERESTIKDN